MNITNVNGCLNLRILYPKKNTGILFASIYNFSISVEERLECFKEAIANNIQLLFCDENLIVDNMEDLKIIKKYYEFYYK